MHTSILSPEENARLYSVYMRPWTLHPEHATSRTPLLENLGLLDAPFHSVTMPTSSARAAQAMPTSSARADASVLDVFAYLYLVGLGKCTCHISILSGSARCCASDRKQLPVPGLIPAIPGRKRTIVLCLCLCISLPCPRKKTHDSTVSMPLSCRARPVAVFPTENSSPYQVL